MQHWRLRVGQVGDRTLMVGMDDWPAAQPLAGEHVQLEPLRVEHADEMAPLLDDPALHTFTGGEPDTLGALRHRYEQQVLGRSPDGRQRWLNWVVRREDGQATGTVQATVSQQNGAVIAEIAWVIGTSHQRRGYAREAAQAMTAWLRAQGADVVIAHVHPDHAASMAVARGIGLVPTDTVLDGEVRWQN